MRSELARTAPLRSKPKRRVLQPGETEWKQPRYGRCESCGVLWDRPLHGHHVIPRQVLARHGLPQYDSAVRMDLCEFCHMSHEFGLANRKIPMEKLPALAVLFAAKHGLIYELERRYRA